MGFFEKFERETPKNKNIVSINTSRQESTETGFSPREFLDKIESLKMEVANLNSACNDLRRLPVGSAMEKADAEHIRSLKVDELKQKIAMTISEIALLTRFAQNQKLSVYGIKIKELAEMKVQLEHAAREAEGIILPDSNRRRAANE